MSDNLPTLVHIFGQTPHHYIPMKSFFEKVDSESEFKQEFWAWSHPEHLLSAGIIFYDDAGDLFKRMNSEQPNTHFIFHGMFDRSIWPKLFFSTLPKRCSWVCWGADLYQHQELNVGIKKRIMFLIHTLLVKRFRYSYALNQGDAELIKSILHSKNVGVLPYPLIGSSITPEKKENSQPVSILVGNSAARSNEHIQVLHWLSHFKDENVRIVVPLNYAGTPEYVQQVMKVGQDLFAGKFQPITRMLDKQAYDKLLACMDIVVFAHNRQQGLYVVYSALKQGKKIFIRGNTSTFLSLQKAGFCVNKSELVSTMSFTELLQQEQADTVKNAQLMQATYSEQALTPKWLCTFKKIFI